MEQRRRAQLRARTAIAGGTCAVLIVGAIGLLVVLGGTDDNPSVDNSEVPVVVSTTPATTSETTPASDPPATTTPDSTTPPTTAALISTETQWALDYIAGSPGEATGEPVRIGFVNTVRNDSAAEIAVAVDAASKFLNAEVGGIGGRPIELVKCEMSDFGPRSEVDACVNQMSDDSIVGVLVGQVDFLSTFWADMGATKPMLIVYPPYDVIG